jgi:hypothetical protein
MVAPTPFFNVGVDFGPLITKLEADLVPIAKTADLQPLATTADLQPLAKTADLQPLAKTADLQPLAKTADLQHRRPAATGEDHRFGHPRYERGHPPAEMVSAKTVVA